MPRSGLGQKSTHFCVDQSGGCGIIGFLSGQNLEADCDFDFQKGPKKEGSESGVVRIRLWILPTEKPNDSVRAFLEVCHF